MSVFGVVLGMLSQMTVASFHAHPLNDGLALIQRRVSQDLLAESLESLKPREPPAGMPTLNVVVISDRSQALLGALGSLVMHTTHPTIAHVISRNQHLAEELSVLTGNLSSIVTVNIIPFSSVVRDLKQQGIVPVWQWPEFGRSIADPDGWLQNGSVRVEKWDNLTVHSNPMNLLRFYLPVLKQFRALPKILFMDDDVIVNGDLARLSQMSPASGKIQLATCGLWRWGGGSHGQCESFGFQRTTPLRDTDFMYLNGKSTQSPLYQKSLEATIQEVNGMAPDWNSTKYWNYGFVLMNLTEWRRVNMSQTFVSWFKANYVKRIFPEYSLSYGLGLAQLMLMGKVQCWDDLNISITDGLGYVSTDDFERSNISLASLRSSFALHWSGTEKPFVESTPQSFRTHWNDVVSALGMPKIKDLVPPDRQKALLVTDTPSGSEWFLDLLDQHPRVCASKGGRDAFPREALITGDFDSLGINYCSRSVSCTWSFISQWVPVFYKYKETYCGKNAAVALWRAQFPNAGDVYRFNRARLCSWVDIFHQEKLTMNPQSLFNMYTRVAFSGESNRLLGCTCPASKDIQMLKFVSDWWVGDQQKTQHFDPRVFHVAKSQFLNDSSTDVRHDFRYKDGYLNRLHSAELSINFSDFVVVSFSRENIFEQYVSERRSFAAVKSPETIGKPIKINVNQMLHYIDDAIKLRHSFFTTLSRESSRVLYLTYEECVINPRACSDRVQAHLGLADEPAELSQFMVALKDEDVFAHISNANAVRQALQEYGLSRWIKGQAKFARVIGSLEAPASDSMRATFVVPTVKLTYKPPPATEPVPSYWWDGKTDRLVFLHIHRTGGSTLTEVLGGKDFPTVNISGRLVPRHSLRNTVPCLQDATCKIQNFAADVADGPEREKCWNEWPGATTHYIRRLREIETTNCRLVELHHFDITGAMPFVRNDFKVITIIREPVSHLGSRFEYELLHRWNWTGELEGESYNSTFEKFAQWTEYQSSPQQALRYLTGCSSSRIADAQLDFLLQQIEDISPGLCRYEYLDGYAKFPVAPNAASSMIQMAAKVAREKVTTILLFEAWKPSLELAAKKHSYDLFNEDLHLNAVGTKQFDFSMLPVERQRHLRARLLPDTQLYDLMATQFLEDANKHDVDLSAWYSECECTEFRFSAARGNVLCENKVSLVGSRAKMCVPPGSDGTCELDQIMCLARTKASPPGARESLMDRFSKWEDVALHKLTEAFKTFRAYFGAANKLTPLETPTLLATPTLLGTNVTYSYEMRPETYCGGSKTRLVIGPEIWSLEDALSACDGIEGCLCVSKHSGETADDASWELSIFSRPDEKQTLEMNSLLLNTDSMPICAGAQQWVAGDSCCFLSDNKDWVTYKKNL